MSNCAFGYPIFSDASVSYTPTLSGGSFQAALPLTNLQDRQLSKLARSTNALAASTTFDIDLKTARDVGVLSILLPNITKSSTPTVQWKLSNVSNFGSTVYDSTALQAWPTGVTAEDADGMNIWSTHVPASTQNARYIRVAVVDTANADGYVDFARVCVCGRYVPTTNFSLGSRSQLESETVRKVTDGGAAVYRERPRRRGHVISLANIPESEALGGAVNPWKLTRRAGTSGQLFFVYDTADSYMHERAFLAVLRSLGALENPDYRYAMAFDIVEEL